jgi:hypothetical protein
MRNQIARVASALWLAAAMIAIPITATASNHTAHDAGLSVPLEPGDEGHEVRTRDCGKVPGWGTARGTRVEVQTTGDVSCREVKTLGRVQNKAPGKYYSNLETKVNGWVWICEGNRGTWMHCVSGPRAVDLTNVAR